MRPFRILRRTLYTLLALTLALFAFVQFQQHLLRHRAERLHAEILALQLHPGTFADIQRLQKEWGRFARYEGECTEHHCIYEIVLKDVLGNYLYSPRSGVGSWKLALPYSWLGGHVTLAGANVRVHENRMWGEDFSLTLLVEPWQNTREHRYGETHADFGLFVNIDGGPHLIEPGEVIQPDQLMKGWRVGFRGACSGCIGLEVFLTPRTAQSDIAWLTGIDFSCITRFQGCQDEDELIPVAAAHRDDLGEHEWKEPDLSQIPMQILGQESSEAALVQIIRQSDYNTEALVIERLKNANRLMPHTTNVFPIDPEIKLTPGQQYIFIFNETYSPDFGTELTQTQTLSATPERVAEFRAGVALDPSTGERYDFRRVH